MLISQFHVNPNIIPLKGIMIKKYEKKIKVTSVRESLKETEGRK